MRSQWIGCALAITLLAGCAGNPQPGDEGYAFNLNGEYAAEFITDDDGTAITGTVTLGTGKDGVVTGAMALRNPFTVDGDIEGVIVGSELTLASPYTVMESGCSGVASGTGEIAEGGGSVSGHVDIADECEGAPTGATFTLVLR